MIRYCSTRNQKALRSLESRATSQSLVVHLLPYQLVSYSSSKVLDLVSDALINTLVNCCMLIIPTAALVCVLSIDTLHCQDWTACVVCDCILYAVRCIHSGAFPPLSCILLVPYYKTPSKHLSLVMFGLGHKEAGEQIVKTNMMVCKKRLKISKDKNVVHLSLFKESHFFHEFLPGQAVKGFVPLPVDGKMKPFTHSRTNKTYHPPTPTSGNTHPLL